MPPVTEVVQIKVVALTFDVNAMEVVSPLQMVCEVGLTVAVGIGLTVITTSVGIS